MRRLQLLFSLIFPILIVISCVKSIPIPTVNSSLGGSLKGDSSIGNSSSGESSLDQPSFTCREGEYFSDYTEKCEESRILLGIGNEEIESFNLDALKSKFEVTELTISNNPAYEGNDTIERIRRYRGFKFSDILQSKIDVASFDEYVVAFTCLDGFDPTINFEITQKLGQLDALLAFQQVDPEGEKEELSKDGLWELIKTPMGIVSPGPFYLIWSTPEGTYWQAWPFQIKSIRIIKASDYEEMISKIRPSQEVMEHDPKSNIQLGFEQFRGKCLTCHQINGFGGTKASVNLIERIKGFPTGVASLEFIEFIIKNPPSGMSDIKDTKFSEGDIEKINEYLRHMAQGN